MHLPPKKIMSRTFLLMASKEVFGTCFAIPINGFFYFITAAHLFKNRSEEITLHLLKNDDFFKVDYDFYLLDSTWDVAVVKTKIPVSDREPSIILSSENMIVGQDLYFIGFPLFGFIGCSGRNSEGFPAPLINKAILSGVQRSLIFLDDSANPGSSGSPVIFWDYIENKHKICGVMSRLLMNRERNNGNTQSSFYVEMIRTSVAIDISVVNEMIKKLNI